MAATAGDASPAVPTPKSSPVSGRPHLVPAADDVGRAAAVAAALARANGKIRSTHLAELSPDGDGGIDVAASSRIAAAAVRQAARAPPAPAEEPADAEADALRREQLRWEMQRDLDGPSLADAGFFQRACYYFVGWFWASLFGLARWLSETRLMPAFVRRAHIDGGAGRGQAPRAPVVGFSIPSLSR